MARKEWARIRCEELEPATAGRCQQSPSDEGRYQSLAGQGFGIQQEIDMTNAQMIENFVATLVPRIQHRMNNLGDTYEKARSMVQLETCAGERVWALLDAHFAG